MELPMTLSTSRASIFSIYNHAVVGILVKPMRLGAPDSCARIAARTNCVRKRSQLCSRSRGCADAEQVLLLSARMGDPKHILDDLAATLAHVLPAGLTREAEKNLRAALQSALARLDLVTREELEVQEQVLARTRARLQEMEKKITELEEKLKK